MVYCLFCTCFNKYLFGTNELVHLIHVHLVCNNNCTCRSHLSSVCDHFRLVYCASHSFILSISGPEFTNTLFVTKITTLCATRGWSQFGSHLVDRGLNASEVVSPAPYSGGLTEYGVFLVRSCSVTRTHNTPTTRLSACLQVAAAVVGWRWEGRLQQNESRTRRCGGGGGGGSFSPTVKRYWVLSSLRVDSLGVFK